VIEILNRYGVEYKEDSYTSEINILCPFHNDHNFGSAKINEETGLFNCFSCGKGGNIYQFVALLEGIEENEAYKLVANNFSDSYTYDINKLKDRKLLSQTTKNNLGNKVVDNVLNNLTKIHKLEIKHKWVVICSWVKYHINELKDKQLLEIYSEFNKEIK
jgi:DNA primase